MFGRRKLQLIATLLYSIVGVAPYLMDSLVAIIVWRLALGVCEAAILTVTNTSIADFYGSAQRRTCLMVQAAMGPIFGVSVLTLSGHLAGIDWHLPFLIYAVAFPIFHALLFLIFEPAVAKQAQESLADTPFPMRHVVLTGGVTLFAASLYYVYIVQIGLTFGGISIDDPSRIGLLIGLANIGVFIGGLMFQPLSGRYASSTQIAIFLSIMGVGMVGIRMASSAATMTIFATVQQLGTGILIPVLAFWTMQGLPERHCGRGTF